MTNFEKYKKDILKIIEKNHKFYLNLKTKKIEECYSNFGCKNCAFDNDVIDCDLATTKWLFKEEDLKITQSQYYFLLSLPKGTGIRKPLESKNIYEFNMLNKIFQWDIGKIYGELPILANGLWYNVENLLENIVITKEEENE